MPHRRNTADKRVTNGAGANSRVIILLIPLQIRKNIIEIRSKLESFSTYYSLLRKFYILMMVATCVTAGVCSKTREDLIQRKTKVLSAIKSKAKIPV